MVESGSVPERGDIVWLDFAPQAGREQSGRCPALTLSPAPYDAKVGLALFCPITSRVKNYPFEVALPVGLAVSGVVLADQIRSFDWRTRNATFVALSPVSVLVAVQDYVEALLRD